MLGAGHARPNTRRGRVFRGRSTRPRGCFYPYITAFTLAPSFTSPQHNFYALIAATTVPASHVESRKIIFQKIPHHNCCNLALSRQHAVRRQTLTHTARLKQRKLPNLTGMF
jgi:hypothetical protein